VDSFSERLWPSWWLTLALGLFLPAGFLIFLPLNPLVGFAVGAGLWVGSWAVLAFFAPTVSASADGFRAGSAAIGWEHVSHVDVIRSAEARQATGVGLDARAWVVIRPWVKPAIRLHISDPSDPTPYWLVSSNTPDKLADVCRRYLGQS
jgi:hypothetical protein